MNYTHAVITPEDFARERNRRDREELDRISKSKSINKKWMAYCRGFDPDYTPNPNKGQNE